MSKNTVRKEVIHADFGSDRSGAALVDEFDRFFGEQSKVEPAKPVAVKPVAVSTAGTATAPVRATYDDPLMAELARIVGQGGAAPRPEAAPVAAPVKPHDPLAAFEEELRRFDAVHRAATQHVSAPAPVHQAEHHAEAPLTASRAAPVESAPLHDMPELRGTYVEPVVSAHAANEAPAPLEPDYQQPIPDLGAVAQEARPRSRKVVMLLSTAAVVALVGVIGAVAMKGGKGRSGEPPIIVAKTQPMKEKPADPGGVEIPGQDRQVLAKGSTDPKGPATVVNKEEQPVDLNQTPKREVSRVILAAPSSQAATSAPAAAPPVPIIMPPSAATPSAVAAQSQPQSTTTAGGFEAKRVRSVKVGPEGEAVTPKASSVPSLVNAPPRTTTAAPVQTAAPKVEAPKAEPVKTETVRIDPPKSDARPSTATRAPAATTTPTRTAARPAPAAEPEPAEGAANAPLSLRPPAGSSPTRPVARATTPAPTTTASTGGSGGYSVQLAAAPTEADARSAAGKLKQQYSALSGHNPTWRTSEVNGRTVYRVRVSGMSRESATELCSKIKAGGGSCFVAGN